MNIIDQMKYLRLEAEVCEYVKEDKLLVYIRGTKLTLESCFYLLDKKKKPPLDKETLKKVEELYALARGKDDGS